MKRIAISGVRGQIGKSLANYLVSNRSDILVYGMKRPNSDVPKDLDSRIILIDADLTDSGGLDRFIKESFPDIFFNMAGFSSIFGSFNHPESTLQVNTIGVIRLLECIKNLGLSTKFIQASSYETLALNSDRPVHLGMCQRPASPYSVSKAASDSIIELYRNSGMWAASALLGNIEGVCRPDHFVSRKITKYVGKFNPKNFPAPLRLGYLDARRDFCHIQDAIDALLVMADQDTPKNTMICTGRTHSVREFLEKAFLLKNIIIKWEGTGIDEKGYGIDPQMYYNHELVSIDKDLFRPADVPILYGSPDCFGWQPKLTIENIVQDMVESDSKYGE